MTIPKSITRAHIIQAIEQLRHEVPHVFGPSTTYDVVYEGRRYPPKAVVGLAAEIATGAPLVPADFSGGDAPGEANAFLRNLGFQIESKPQVAAELVQPSVWLEMTQSSHQHGGAGWEFGTCLWSPSKNRAGRDWYRIMRDPRIGERVIHCLDSVIVGESEVARACVETNDQPPSPGSWEGLAPYYRVDLQGYKAFGTPLPLATLVREYRERIVRDVQENNPQRYPFFVTKQAGIHTVQGGYLTRCTPALTEMIDEGITGRTVSISDVGQKRVPGRRYWCLALGEDGRMWPECFERGLALIGWDTLGNLLQYADLASIEARLAEVRQNDKRPTNDALACWEFAREMHPGDLVLVKRGIAEILGLGEVTSEYEYLADRPEYKHARRVKWTASGHWPLPADQRLPQKTLTDITHSTELLDYVLPLIARAPGASSLSGPPLYTIDDALKDLFVERDALLAMFNAFSRKKNLIIEGPPGVGKTLVARRLAYARVGYKDQTRVAAVQLHQSYAYEDFVQGWRPQESGGFVLKNGIFYDFCERAREDASTPYVFIIDEINRGNISKVFGELLMLIEADKRGEEFSIPLTYASDADDQFCVPENVYLLGMMNTADRSLAMVDYALRRRFAFARLQPGFRTPQFTSWLRSAGVDEELIEIIVSRMTALNDVIARDHRNLGPGFQIGHSYFCPTSADEQLDRAWYDGIIRQEVEPLLREYWFDNSAKVDNLVSELLR